MLEMHDAPPEGTSPRRARWGHTWLEEANQLRANPGKWALIKTFPSNYPTDPHKAAHNLAHSARGGRNYPAFAPSGSFDAVIRKMPDGAWQVWASFIG